MTDSVCKNCGQPNRLVLKAALELSNDANYDDNRLSFWACPSCFARVISIYRESRRGSLDSEASQTDCHLILPDDFSNWIDQIKSCPDPERSDCQCEVHQTLGKLDENDNWIGWLELAFYGRVQLSDNFISSATIDWPQVIWSELPLSWLEKDKGQSHCSFFGYDLALELGDFPAEPLYLIFLNGERVGHFDDWPESHLREHIH